MNNFCQCGGSTIRKYKRNKKRNFHISFAICKMCGRIWGGMLKDYEGHKYISSGNDALNLFFDKSNENDDLNIVRFYDPLLNSCAMRSLSKLNPDKIENLPLPTPEIFKLDENLIDVRTEETRRVKCVLNEIFLREDDEIKNNSSNIIKNIPVLSSFVHLDEVHQLLFNSLLARECWDLSEINDKCNELGLMADGALEVLNEWAFENSNALLIDYGDPVYFDVILAKEIMNDQ